MDKDFFCEECEAEFQVQGDSLDGPSYCPYCGTLLAFEKADEEEDWDDQDRETF